MIINGDKAKILYRLPMPPDGKRTQSVEVLPIDTPGGEGVTEMMILIESIQGGQRSPIIYFIRTRHDSLLLIIRNW